MLFISIHFWWCVKHPSLLLVYPLNVMEPLQCVVIGFVQKIIHLSYKMNMDSWGKDVFHLQKWLLCKRKWVQHTYFTMHKHVSWDSNFQHHCSTNRKQTYWGKREMYAKIKCKQSQGPHTQFLISMHTRSCLRCVK